MECPRQEVDIQHETSYPQALATLPANIGSLSASEKFDLLDALWEDLETHAPALSTEQEQELDLRVAAYAENPSAVLSWEQVKAGRPSQ